ncbi:hypothetical protein FQN57_000616 [Myotisia sp. PD_48]|nr:hypothetical protein FQN57_000616 [Myotisia sp. PD_48]
MQPSLMLRRVPSPFPQSSNDSWGTTLVATFAEFVGTVLYLLFAFAGSQVARVTVPAEPKDGPPDLLVLFYVALSFGVALTVNVWVFYRVTGGMFNPVVALALALTGAITPLRAVLVSIAQVVGGIVAAALVSTLFPGPLVVSTRLGGGTSIVRGLFLEMFFTAQLIITIIMLAVVKHRATFLAPIGIGLSFFLAELIGIYYTGGSLNPARSFGPDVVNGSFPGYHWIYWVGPILGACLAAAFYHGLVFLRYQNVDPGQDSDGMEVDLITSETRERDNLRV